MIKYRAEARVHLHWLGGSSMLARPVLAVPELGGDEFLKSGCCAPAATECAALRGNHAEGIFRPCLAVVLPGTTVMAPDVQLRRMERQHEGHGVIVPGSVSKMILPEAGAAKHESRRERAGGRGNPKFAAAADKLPTDVRHRVDGDERTTKLPWPIPFGHTLHEQHAALRSRNKPPDRIGVG